MIIEIREDHLFAEADPDLVTAGSAVAIADRAEMTHLPNVTVLLKSEPELDRLRTGIHPVNLLPVIFLKT